MGETAPFDDNGHGDGESLVGRTIAGKFVLEAALGAGAMGVVYRARQVTLDKIVAIKVMHTAIAADKTYSARFQREARAASRLDHPNSVHMLDFGQEPDGLLYIAMEYLGGRDLLDVINEEWPLSTKRIVDILSQALSALAVAHDMGVLHRDLKPENLMILPALSDEGAPTDNIKVCDFGIAKIYDPKDANEGQKLTTGHLVVGTPAYMAPEQAHSEEIDGRVDVYSMGVILYQLLTRRVPFEASTPLATVLKLTQEDAVLPSKLIPNVDPELEEICLKAISKKPGDRYASARDMRSALRAVLGGNGSGTRAVRSRQLTTMPPPQERSRLMWAMGGAAAVIGFSAAFLVDRLGHHPVTVSTGLVMTQPSAPSDQEKSPGSMPLPASAAAPAARTTEVATSSPASVAKPRKSKAAAPSPDKVDAPEHEVATPPSAAAPPEAPAVEAPPSAVPVPPAPPRSAPPAETTTTAPPRAVAPAPAPPPLDPNFVRVEVGSATSFMGTTTASVNKVMSPLAAKLSACHRAAIPQTVEGTINLHIETDLDGVITQARLGGTLPPSIASCIVNAVHGRKIPNVDTGIATADVPLSFKTR